MSITNTIVTLAARPEGMAKESDFKMIQKKVAPLEEGSILIKVELLSLDPAIRGWMNKGTTYIKGVELGTVMRTFAAGQVIESKNPAYEVGEYVYGLLGAQAYAISDGQGLTKCDISKGQLSWHAGILGMPGMTAFFGLLEKGKPNHGDTVFVSGAAGIVGSTVGQIAKLKGCNVIGTAGSDEKCAYLINECNFDAAINYKSQDISTELRKHALDGIDVFYDNVGGPLLDTAMLHLARGSRIVICGAISQYNNNPIYGPSNYMKIVTARGTLQGIIVFDYIDQYPRAVDEISRWLKSGQIKTKEHYVNGLENFASAVKMLFTGDNFGKLLLKV